LQSCLPEEKFIAMNRHNLFTEKSSQFTLKIELILLLRKNSLLSPASPLQADEIGEMNSAYAMYIDENDLTSAKKQ
jgi:hypothetical protein